MNQCFSLDPREDIDIIEWLSNQPNKSEAIREALHGWINPQVVLQGDINEPVSSSQLQLLQKIARDVKEIQNAINQGLLNVASQQHEKDKAKHGEEIPENILDNMKGLQI